MPSIEYSGTEIELDDEGYLARYEDWNEDAAHALAEREGVGELTQEKMDILHFMRDYYNKFKSFPILRAVCRNIHQPDNCTYEQFPDPIKAWKVAGLPKPTTEVLALIKHQM
jgi:tRNA 2-thiouridine synthesizing protein E